MAWSRVSRILAEVSIVVAVIVVVLFAQDTFGDKFLAEEDYQWTHLLQNATTNVTVGPTPPPVAGTVTITFRYDLPGVTVIQQLVFRNGVVVSLMVTLIQVVINQIISPIPAVAASNKFQTEQTPGSRVIFSVSGLTPAQAAAAQNTLTTSCPANLAPLGVNCASLATSATTVPVAPPVTDDDTSGLVGGLAGGIGGCCCILGLVALAALLLKKKKQQNQFHNQEFYGHPQATAAPLYAPPPTPAFPPTHGSYGPSPMPFADPSMGKPIVFGPMPVGGPMMIPGGGPVPFGGPMPFGPAGFGGSTFGGPSYPILM